MQLHLNEEDLMDLITSHLDNTVSLGEVKSISFVVTPSDNDSKQISAVVELE